MMQSSPFKLSLLYCYAPEDAPLRDELDKHLAMLRQLGWIQSWSNRDISAGTNWQHAMEDHLDTANLLLLLISADFLHSDYCYGTEMQQALQRHRSGEAIAIPILLRPVEWEQTPLGILQALPRDGRAITSYDRPDEALKQIAMEIRTIVEALRRPVVVVSSPSQQTITVNLINFLEEHSIPTWHTTTEQVVEPKELQEAARTSSAIVIIASSKTITHHLLQEIQHLATVYQRPTLGIWITATEQDNTQNSMPPKEWNSCLTINADMEWQQEAFLKFRHDLNVLRHHTILSNAAYASDVFERFHQPRNPYKGLRAFTAQDTRYFFGRTTLINKLTRSMATLLSSEKKAGAHARLLTIIGPSGSGKSSFVMAGVLPSLRAGSILQSDKWIYLDPLVPDKHPIDALAQTLFTHFPERSLKMLRDDLYDNGDSGLVFYATAIAKKTERTNSTPVVLVVDQFEELFTLTATEQERQQFINLLVAASTQQESPLMIILTLRADFYDRPMQYPTLCPLIEEHQFLMQPMTLDDLRTIITQPATLPEVQLTFEENLVGDLLFDIQGQVGALPLLQFTLEQLFEKRNGHQLTLSAYYEMGGIKGALARYAEQTYQKLPSAHHRTTARALFLRLIDPGTLEQDTTRRRASLSEFTFADTIQTQIMHETIEGFVSARLLTTNQYTNTTTIEVSHEAVIREWPRLAKWLYESRDAIHFQQTMSKDASEWEQHQKSNDHLYRGIQLKEAKNWVLHNTPNSNELAFIRASAAQHARTITRITITITLLILLLLSTTGLSIWFLTQPNPYSISNTLDNNAPGSLRYAINQATPNSTITFATGLHGTIQLNSDLNIAKNLTFRHDPGTGIIAISGGKSGHLIHILSSTTVTISGLTFANSTTSTYSFIYNQGNLTLDNSTISGNTTLTNSNSNIPIEEQGRGGAIYTTGTLTINNSTISHNTANDGGAIANQGTTMINNSTISQNTAKEGGAIYSDNGNVLTINNSTISYNTATISTGGIYSDNRSTLTLNNSTISHNTTPGDGGGIYNEGQFTVSQSTISGNTALDGAGIYSDALSFTLNKSTVSGNTAQDKGGGIYNTVGILSLNSSTISYNTAHGIALVRVGIENDHTDGGGGIFNTNILSLNNSTIYDNTAPIGGGLEIRPIYPSVSITQVDLNFCTIYHNTAPTGSDITLLATNANTQNNPQFIPIKISNSIVANDPTHPGPDIMGIITSNGYNLFQNDSGATFNPGTSEQHSTDKSLSESDLSRLFAAPVGLRANGGSTETLALAPNSPAINQIPLDACHIAVPSIKDMTGTPTVAYTITTDQRGIKRPDRNANRCDIGAYEL